MKEPGTMFFEWENGDYTIANLTRTFGYQRPI
jgi:hypothetical protein